MPVGVSGDIEELQGRASIERGLTNGAEDISGGTASMLGDASSWTLYLGAEGAVNVEVSLSPDGGTTWYVAPESPVQFDAAGADIIAMGYDATAIRLEGSDATAVEAQVYEVV
ncbi:hypothetical protein [Halobacterium rubrum]|uniref:hypothetical protein n=1 Tax=Halobacterium TaxID=2239 RepID=UPI001F3914E7|nr:MULTISPECIES: hypothetical protein [Halobacterium]MDH5019030.1 hypothetical protein [Halobacterium rubrum]